MKKFREKKVLILILVSILILTAAAGLGIWWRNNLLQTAQNPEEIADASDRLVADEIARNFKGKIRPDEFKELLDELKVEKVSKQYQKKAGVVPLSIYYIKVAGKEGYYLTKTTSNSNYYFYLNGNLVGMPLDDFLDYGSRVYFGKNIEFLVLTSVPKIPFDKNQLIYLGIFVVVIIILSFVLIRWMIRGGSGLGGLGKADTPEMKKPVYFADVGGVDEALEESKEVMELIKAKWGVKNVKK